MKISKKWFIILGIIGVIGSVAIMWGRVIFVYLFINYLLICSSEKDCREEYNQFLLDKSVYEFSEDVSPWTFQTLQSEETDIEHRFFYLQSHRDNAKTVVFLHGFNTDAASFLNFHPLSDQYNLISYHLPEDTKLYQGNFSDYIPVLNDFFDCLKLDSLILLGNSIGGAVASHYVVHQNEKTIEALILVASTNFGAVEKEIKKIRRMKNLLLKHEDYRLFHLMKKGENILTLFREKNSPGRNLVKKKITWYRQILNALYDYKGIPGNRDNEYPVIAIHGENDRLLPIEFLNQFDKAFRNVKYHIIPGGSHAIYNSHPMEIIAQIKHFLLERRI